MNQKIVVFKGEMQTFFDQNGRVFPITKLTGKEFRLDELFKQGDFISVTGISKGKGFAGVVKRYGFKGGPRTHGQSDRERAPGAIGSTTTPGRVLKGKRMAGRLGHHKVTVKNLLVAKIDAGENILYIKGAVPGIKKGAVEIKKIKTRGAIERGNN